MRLNALNIFSTSATGSSGRFEQLGMHHACLPAAKRPATRALPAPGRGPAPCRTRSPFSTFFASSLQPPKYRADVKSPTPLVMAPDPHGRYDSAHASTLLSWGPQDKLDAAWHRQNVVQDGN